MDLRMICAALTAVAIWYAEGKLAPPKIEDYTHVCQKCGKVTHYPKSYTEPRSTVERLRDGCAKLRSLGLDITLDESVLCRHCVSSETLKLREGGCSVTPTSARFPSGCSR